MNRLRQITPMLIGAGLLVSSALATAAPALAVPVSTERADIGRLADGEANIINVARSYAHTGPWKKSFEWAMGTETGDLFTVEDDLHVSTADQPILASTPAPTTAGELNDLVGVEGKLRSVLLSFTPTRGWKTKFNFAVASQSAVMYYVNRDLVGWGEMVRPFFVTFQDDAGTSYSVTPTAVIEPVTPAFGTVRLGYRLLAVQFTVTDLSATASVSVNADTSAGLNDGSAVIWSPDPVKQCTNFQFGEVHVSPKDSVTGCVAFTLPMYTDAYMISWSTGEWTVT